MARRFNCWATGQAPVRQYAAVPPWIASAKLSPQARQVLVAICAQISHRTYRLGLASLTTIATLTGMARKNVPRIISKLETAGVLHRDRATIVGRGNFDPLSGGAQRPANVLSL